MVLFSVNTKAQDFFCKAWEPEIQKVHSLPTETFVFI